MEKDSNAVNMGQNIQNEPKVLSIFKCNWHCGKFGEERREKGKEGGREKRVKGKEGKKSPGSHHPKKTMNIFAMFL